MSDGSSFQLPKASSTWAPEFDAIYNGTFYLSVICFVLICGTMFFFLWKYHRSRHRDAAPTGHSDLLEVAWTFSPLLGLIALFHYGFDGYLHNTVAPADALEIRVTGKKWLWEFEYPNGASEPNKLTVPVGRPVKLIMGSQDVLHSFFIPEFRVKHDVVPGRYSTLWFEATELSDPEGIQVFCTEYCGKDHSMMLAKIHVVTEEAYEKFLEESLKPPEGLTSAQWGEQLSTQYACKTCHSLDGKVGVGPSYKGLFGKTESLADGTTVEVEENYLRESIVNPKAKIVKGYNPVMPSFANLKDPQIDALIAYIKTLK